MIVDSSFYCLTPRVVDSIEISYWFFAKKGRVFWDFHGENAATRTRTRTRESRGSRRGARDIGRSEIRHRARLRFCRGYVKWRSHSGRGFLNGGTEVAGPDEDSTEALGMIWSTRYGMSSGIRMTLEEDVDGLTPGLPSKRIPFESL